ncbi:nucleotide sugar dehydrogenase [Paenibacillus sinopodophylli]|uniref:nucleotide sugar dehydrogenase n=1 Tax=Paenibacillus sinopodophylli TaxID=1837342 RepID=UPI00110D1355|nr:nucleotide sugar dehydrogenase [Paenibacillus sinopodophylli]
MIAVIGLGFVGLTTALGLADKTGQKVYGYDSNPLRRAELHDGQVPFYEPHLNEKLKEHMGNTFIIAENMKQAIINAELIFFCIGTPNDQEGRTELNPLLQAIDESINYTEDSAYKTFVIKSTVPPGTTENHIIPLIKSRGKRIGKDIGLANNPEFLREGMAWIDFIEPDRIVVGVSNGQSSLVLEKLYAHFSAPIYKVSFTNAEFIKYMSNSLLATMISFANEMSMLGSTFEHIDLKQAFHILKQDKRWTGSPAPMTSYVYPGSGFGGYCLPKDVSSLIHTAEEQGYMPTLLKEVVHVNDKVKSFIVAKVEQSVSKNERLGILGLAFKPESDDVRGSASRDIIERLLASGYHNIVAFDPMANLRFHESFNLPIAYAEQLQDLLEECDAVVVLTAWEQFRSVRSMTTNKRIIDGRYFLTE